MSDKQESGGKPKPQTPPNPNSQIDQLNPGLLGGVTGALGNLGDTAGKTVGNIGNTAGSTVGGLSKGVGDTVGGVGQGVGDTVSGLGSSVGGATSQATGGGSGGSEKKDLEKLGGKKQDASNPLGL